MDWTSFGWFLFLRAIAIALIAGFCELAVPLIVCIGVGAVLESAGSMLLDDYDKPVLKQVMYYGGILLQMVPLIVISISFLSMREDQLNFMKAIAMGIMMLMITIGWFANGFSGVASAGFYYGLSIGCYAIEGIIYAIAKTYNTMLIVNFVIIGLCALVMVLARIFLGNNLE